MLVEVRLPQWGMGMDDGVIVAWLKQVGERVEEGDELAEVEAAKTVEVVQSPATGTLHAILAEVDQVVPVRAVIATIDVS